MSRTWLSTKAALFGLLVSPAALADDDRDDDREETSPDDSVTVPGAPAALARELLRAFPGAELVSSTRGEDAVRVHLRDGRVAKDVFVDPEGTVLAQAVVVPPSQAPVHIRKTVARQFGSATLWRTEHVVGAEVDVWHVTFATKQRVGEALVAADGRLLLANLSKA